MRAARVLTDRCWFVLCEDQWKRFNDLLDAPVGPTPKLDALLSEPTVHARDAPARAF